MLRIRYLNCVAVQKMLMAGQLTEAEETVVLFAKSGEGGGNNLARRPAARLSPPFPPSAPTARCGCDLGASCNTSQPLHLVVRPLLFLGRLLSIAPATCSATPLHVVQRSCFAPFLLMFSLMFFRSHVLSPCFRLLRRCAAPPGVRHRLCGLLGPCAGFSQGPAAGLAAALRVP